MHHLTCGISSLLHSVNLILFTLLVHLVRISPHHSHHRRSHHLSILGSWPWPLSFLLFSMCETMQIAVNSVINCSFLTMYRVGQIKWHHFTFLLVTNECINKISWFLAQINYIKQQMVWCQFYVNKCVTRQGAPRVSLRVRLIQTANFQRKSHIQPRPIKLSW